MKKSKCYKYAVIERYVNGEKIYYVSPGAAILSNVEKALYANDDLDACIKKREEFENFDDEHEEEEDFSKENDFVEDMEIAKRKFEEDNYYYGDE